MRRQFSTAGTSRHLHGARRPLAGLQLFDQALEFGALSSLSSGGVGEIH